MRLVRPLRALLILLVLAGGAVRLPAAPPSEASAQVQAQYRKEEVLIPMRDGVKLFTAIYTPKDTSRTYPILLQRTPYSVAPYGPEAYPERLGPSARFQAEGFIFVYQDVRGRMMSEGTFVNMRPERDAHPKPTDIDEATDTYDTLDWLIHHVPGNNGKAGQWGISYPGFYAAAGMICGHPALVAVSPEAPIVDWFTGDDFHRNGALWLPHAFNFMVNFGRPRPVPTPDGPVPFRHGTSDGYAWFLRLGFTAATRQFTKDVAFWN
ncbi:MAG TPA: CocE/NonD family hydrolase, partial [Holophagaceae bacterium]